MILLEGLREGLTGHFREESVKRLTMILFLWD